MADSNITKRALAAAMKELMGQAPFAKISVGDICERCGMNRKSFYYHYRDKYELVNWIFNVEFLEVVGTREYPDSWAFLTSMCHYFYENRAFYLKALEVTGQDSFREYFGQVFQPILLSSIEGEFENTKYGAFYATFFADAFLVAIERWLREDSMPPQEFAQLLKEGLAGAARHIMSRLDPP